MKTTKNFYLEISQYTVVPVIKQLVLHNMQFGNFHDQNFKKYFHTRIFCTVCTKILVYMKQIISYK